MGGVVMEKWLEEKDVFIERVSVEGMAPYAELWDCDGERRFTFPGDMTDEQIMVALAFANKGFDKGLSLGRTRALYKVRSALGLSD
jgi:hypothetical protein